MVHTRGIGALIAAVLTSTMGVVPAATATEPTTKQSTAARSDDGVQAATRYRWGRSLAGDEFEGRAVDRSRWIAYDSVGHAGHGLRRPAQITQGNGVLTIQGDSAGTTGGMAFRAGAKYGRWETRMRVPDGDYRYHPVLLLWPDAEDFPVGGEIDYAETTTASDGVAFFLHYSAFNLVTGNSTRLNLNQWHNYAVEWAPSGITGYVDGVPFFYDGNRSHQPPRSMHASIQLDWFPQGGSRTAPSSMQVAWHRYYPL